MIESTVGKLIKDVIEKGSSKKLSRYQNYRANMLIQTLIDVSSFKDLKLICEPPSLRIHKLKGNKKDFWSITIELPYCIIFKYKDGKFKEVEIGNYH
jgi:proteic killer suppression protein